MPSKDDFTEARIAQGFRDAAAERGVKFDPRVCKFTARVYDPVTRRQRWLGSFDTAAEAGQAYRSAPETKKRSEGPRGAFGRNYAQWLSEQPLNREGYKTPVAGSEFYPDDEGDQGFTYRGLVWKWIRGSRWAFYAFDSECATCGEPFSTVVPRNSKGARGITRNCEAHRKEHPFKRAEAVSKNLQDATSAQHVADAADVAHEPEDGSDLI